MLSHEEAQDNKTAPNTRTAMTDGEVMNLCDVIRRTSLAIHQYLRHGHLEKVYENALLHRLSGADLKLEAQRSLKVFDEDGTVLGTYTPDILVEDSLIVEIKAAQTLTEAHIAQLLGYLRASHYRHGLLINFGTPKLQIRKFKL